MTPIPLHAFNALDPDEAAPALLEVCESQVWAERILQARPYPSVDSVLVEADRVLTELSDTEFARAVAGHPRIGDRTGSAASRSEQAGIADADHATLAELARLNGLYEERHGHVYLVCAVGRAATELLAILEDRVGNDTASERAVARRELAEINRNRLRQLLTPEYAPNQQGVDAS